MTLVAESDGLFRGSLVGCRGVWCQRFKGSLVGRRQVSASMKQEGRPRSG